MPSQQVVNKEVAASNMLYSPLWLIFLVGLIGQPGNTLRNCFLIRHFIFFSKIFDYQLNYFCVCHQGPEYPGILKKLDREGIVR